MKATVFQKAYFNAAHRLNNPNWTTEQNKAVFGKCNNPNYHGHNYEVILKVTGEVQPDTGFVINMMILLDLLNEFVVEKYDHKNLNLDTEEFRDLNPTSENIARVIWETLRPKLDSQYDIKVQLHENQWSSVQYPTDSSY